MENVRRPVSPHARLPVPWEIRHASIKNRQNKILRQRPESLLYPCIKKKAGHIVIHQYQNHGYNIVLDVNSGSVHVVDKTAYDVIACLERQNPSHTCDTLNSPGTLEALLRELPGYPEEEVSEVLEAVTELTRAGQLFTQDIYEDYIDEVKQRKTVVKALCLHIAHDCNLACRYCFAEEGEYHGRRAMMSPEVGKKALDFLVQNSGNRHNLEVDFFGGEPLMNWKTVKELVAYGRELEQQYDKHFRFTLTTNGVLLNDEVQEFVNREMDNVVLSLDGRKEINDRMRPFPNGSGSYDLIVPKFQRLAESRNQEKYYIRGTFTRENLDFSKDVMHYVDLGFRQISIEPVVGGDTDPYAIQESDLPRTFEEYDILADQIIEYERKGKGFQFFHFMIDLEGGPCVAKRLSGCGSGTEYLAVTPWGDLYPCHQFVGNKKFLMGNVWDGVFNHNLRNEFKSCNVYAKEKCRECFARFYCSGGCAANAYNFQGDIRKTYDTGCVLQKKRVECAIMIKAALAEEAD